MTRNTFEAKDNHGQDQAAAQAQNLTAMVAALNCDFDRLQELKDEREALGDAVTDAEIEHAQAVREGHAQGVHAANLLDKAREALSEWLQENGDEMTELSIEANDCDDQDEARARIQENALSVEVRSGWTPAQDVPFSAAEFRIVLCTGGPHVEICGELDRGTPCRAWLQYQDWGTPMTQFFNVEQSTLLAYCQEFYFGE
jgi:hypothetical protein